MSGKCVKQKNILVLCRHDGVLLNYSALLNDVGYFRIGLCSSIKEVKRALAKTQRIDCFIVDGFKIGTADEQHIRNLNHGCLINRFLLAATSPSPISRKYLRGPAPITFGC